MFITTTRWPQSHALPPNPTSADVPALRAVAEAIPGFIQIVKNNDLDFVIGDLEPSDAFDGDFVRIVTRHWATREAAQQWADYISANHQASVTIDEVE